MNTNPQPTAISPCPGPASRFPAARLLLGPAILTLLLLSLSGREVADLVRRLLADSDTSHGLLIPPIVAYLVWRKRELLAATTKRSSPAGLLPVLAGAVLFPLGLAAEVSFLRLLALYLILGGLVWHIWGGAVLRTLLFPYLFLFFTIPWPSLLTETLTFHLQFISAKTATLLLGLLGVPVSREGVEIHLGSYAFAVGAPCSGMRSLAALLALGALCAFLLRGALWQRGVLFLSVPALAFLGNALRIVVILLIARHWGPKAAEGFFHNLSGLLVFLITFLLLLAVGRLLGMKQLREDL